MEFLLHIPLNTAFWNKRIGAEDKPGKLYVCRIAIKPLKVYQNKSLYDAFLFDGFGFYCKLDDISEKMGTFNGQG